MSTYSRGTRRLSLGNLLKLSVYLGIDLCQPKASRVWQASIPIIIKEEDIDTPLQRALFHKQLTQNVSIAKMATETGLSTRCLTLLIRGVSTPTQNTLLILCEYLGLNPQSILDGMKLNRHPRKPLVCDHVGESVNEIQRLIREKQYFECKTLSAMAAEINITSDSLKGYASARYKPSQANLAKLAIYFGQDLKELEKKLKRQPPISKMPKTSSIVARYQDKDGLNGIQNLVVNMLKSQNISIRQLAKESGIPKSTLFRYVHKNCVPCKTHLLKLADFFGVNDIPINRIK